MSKPFSNPVRHCVICLRHCGLGVKRIGRITRTDHSLVLRWVKKAGFQRMDKRKASRVGFAAFKKKWIDTGAFKSKFARCCAQVTRSEFAASMRAIRENCIGNDRVAHARLREGKSKVQKQRDTARAYYHANKKRIYDRFRSKPRNIIKSALRRRLYHFVRGTKRVRGFENYCGCSATFLCAWLESQFKKGMSWSNYGDWHIDHKIPCSSFNLQNQADQKKCFHYTNLQPLWASDNHKKSDSINPTQLSLMINMK